MTNEQNTRQVDFGAERERLHTQEQALAAQREQREKLEWFKPKQGQHKIVFLTNGHRYTAKIMDGTVEKNVEKLRFEIETGGVKYSWGVTIGETTSSLYGQIILLGSVTGTLIGTSCTLVVKGVGKATQYTILEALPLMSGKEETVAN